MRYAHRALDRFFGQTPSPNMKGSCVAVLKGSVVGCSRRAQGKQTNRIGPLDEIAGTVERIEQRNCGTLSDHFSLSFRTNPMLPGFTSAT